MCTDESCNHPWTCSCGDCSPGMLILNAPELPDGGKPDSEGKIVLEASTLGLPPGYWPKWIDLRQTDVGAVSYVMHRRVRRSTRDGGPAEVVAVVYVARKGQQIHILND